MNNDLSIITVAKNDKISGLLDIMISSVRRFTDFEPKFIICDNGGNDNLSEKYEEFENITVIDNTKEVRGKKHTGWQHAMGLNKAAELVETDRMAIIEHDCLVLSKNWCKIPDGKRMLACQKGVGLKGEPYYYICFVVLDTDIINDIDFSLSSGKGDGILLKENAKKTYSDVGWKLYKGVKSDEVALMSRNNCSTEDTKYFGKQFPHKSNEFWINGEPLAAHFWRGSELARKGKHRRGLEEWKDIACGIINE
jgi:glycosyltransferase involved in cell wall biosynthesis